jgi:glycolate oxidase
VTVTAASLDALLVNLTRLLGRKRVLSDPSELIVYETDGCTMHNTQPSAVVFPQGTEEVVSIVQACRAHGIPFVARGAGTGLSGGAMALNGGIIIALNRMNRILEVDVENRRATVEPGVRNLAVSEAAAPHGLFYAPDPSSQAVCTLGGNVAHNSGGPHTLKHGVTVNHVLGLELVTPLGERVRIGGSDRPGYDLLALLTGAEGTLGIVTEIEVGLRQLPEGVRTLLASFPDIDHASEAVSALIGEGMVPAALEMLDDVVVTALEAAFGFEFQPGAGALLLVESDGPMPGLNREAADIEAVCWRCGALDVRSADTAKERADVWTARKKAFGALGRIARHYYTQDGVIPRTRLPDMLRYVRQVAERHELRIANVFHAGDGNLHPCILYDDSGPEMKRTVLEAGAEILRYCIELGGSLTGEHGVGVEKREWMTLMFTESDLELMRRLRDAWNPEGLCNPGKVLPTGGSCAELSPQARQVAL